MFVLFGFPSSVTCRRAGDAAGALTVLRGMSKMGISPGEHAIASTMEAFAQVGDVNQVMSLIKVNVLRSVFCVWFFLRWGVFSLFLTWGAIADVSRMIL